MPPASTPSVNENSLSSRAMISPACIPRRMLGGVPMPKNWQAQNWIALRQPAPASMSLSSSAMAVTTVRSRLPCRTISRTAAIDTSAVGCTAGDAMPSVAPSSTSATASAIVVRLSRTAVLARAPRPAFRLASLVLRRALLHERPRPFHGVLAAEGAPRQQRL